ncbi:UNKNOWN [Stylonychia lemnae]|uniref:Uncharacterized protein n=1 Tax=Stylonychia lemnae TaxID=5949 RepID=A0A078AYX3_STYLE|nr:UNKNOWN [Stylonychia lemnae]|eukprot:CDW87645.1 UNKNOWN [Stylonychia lemnae]
MNGNEDAQSVVLTNICTSPAFGKTADDLRSSNMQNAMTASTIQRRVRPHTAKSTKMQNMINSINNRVYSNRLNSSNNKSLAITHQVDRACRHSLISKISQQNLVDDNECNVTQKDLKQQRTDIKKLNSCINLLESNEKNTEINFNNKIDEIHEDWQEQYKKLKTQGKKQKKLLKEKYESETQVLEYRIENEDKLKEAFKDQMIQEEQLIRQLQSQIMLSQSETQTQSEKIKKEQQMFSERLDKLKKQKEDAAFQSIQIQNAISSKIIEAMHLKLLNNQLNQDLQLEFQRNERLERIQEIEKNFREEVAYSLLISLINPEKISGEVQPVITNQFKKVIRTLRQRYNAVDNEVELISHLQKDKNSCIFIPTQSDSDIQSKSIEQIKSSTATNKSKRIRPRPLTAKKQSESIQ